MMNQFHENTYPAGCRKSPHPESRNAKTTALVVSTRRQKLRQISKLAAHRVGTRRKTISRLTVSLEVIRYH